MTDRRFYYEAKMNVTDVSDKTSRSSLFKEISRDFIGILKQGDDGATPEVLASVLESAFRSGRESAVNVMDARQDLSRRFMDETDIPDVSREAISSIRDAIFGTSTARMRKIQPRDVALVFARRERVSIVGDHDATGWIQSGLQYINRYGDDVIKPLVDLGLITVSPRDNAGILSEWGYEFIVTGKTLLPFYREPAASSTSSEWAYLVRSGALRKGLAFLSRQELLTEDRPVPAFS